ncbi:hypothetical protein R1flu_001612 [Riccia fluitans]|uniref:Uncharacterized protein n=1 Tax=Riccia fluitans TaxID=41844 RepID=A0ABD1Y730_9MARC
MVDEAAGRRLPTIRLMDEELYKANSTEQIRRFYSRIQFVPYSFKELKDLDHVKISAMYCLNMVKYVTSLQRHYVPEDIFLWRHSAAIDTWKKCYEDQLSKIRELQETNDGLREQLAAKDVEKSDVHALAQTKVQHELEEFERSMTEKEKAAQETHLQKLVQVQTELDEYKQSSKASIKRLDKEASRLREALVAKESVVQALVDAHQKEISTLKATCRKYTTTLDAKIGTNVDLHARVENLEDELNASKYMQEQALQAHKSSRAELFEVKKELQML